MFLLLGRLRRIPRGLKLVIRGAFIGVEVGVRKKLENKEASVYCRIRGVVSSRDSLIWPMLYSPNKRMIATYDEDNV